MRGARGHILIETMAGGAVLLTAMVGISSALIASSQQIGIATADQEAQHVAMQQLELLRSLPATDSLWALGTTGPAAAPGHPAYTLTTVVTTVSDADLTGPAGPLTYKRAVVTVAYRNGRTATLETFRW